MTDAVNRVGLGVDLDGGEVVITELRSIRSEMVAIAQASRSIGTNVGGSGVGGAASSASGRRSSRVQAAREEQQELTLIQREMLGQINLFGTRQQDLVAGFQNRMTDTTRRGSRARLDEHNKEIRQSNQAVEQGLRRQAELMDKAANDQINKDRSFYQRKTQEARQAEERIERQRQLSSAQAQAHYRGKSEVPDPGPTGMTMGGDSLGRRVQQRKQEIIAREYSDRQGNVRMPGPDDKIIDRLARRQIEDEVRFTGKVGDRSRLYDMDLEQEAQKKADAEYRRAEIARRTAKYRPPIETIETTDESGAERRRRQQQERDYENNQREMLVRREEKRFAMLERQEREREEARVRHNREIERQQQDEEAERRRTEAAARRPIEPPPSSARRRLDDSPERQARLAESRRLVQEAQFEAEFGGARVDVNRGRDKLIGYQRELSNIGGKNNQFRGQAIELSNSIARIQERAKSMRAELETPASMKRTKDVVNTELKQLQAEFKQTEERIRNFKEQVSRGPSTATGGRGPSNRPSELMNERGFFGTTDMIGRISRNILLYQLVAGATYGLENYIATSFEASRTANKTAIDLETASKKAQQSYDGLVKFAEGIRLGAGVSREAGQRAVAESAYFTEAAPTLTKPLTQAIANIGASRGLGGNEIPDLVEQFRRRESKFYKRYLGRTVEELYKEEAGRVVDRNEDRYVPGEGDTPAERRRNNLTREQRISRQVSLFSEEQKEIIAANAIIAAGNDVLGAAENRQRTMAGQVDRTTARWEDAKVAVGNFFLTLKPLVGLLDAVNSRFERWTQLQLTGTGTGGSITAADVTRSGQERANSLSARAGNFVSDYGMDLALVGGTLAIGGFAGRRQARNNRRRGAYDEALAENIGLGYSQSEAQALAMDAAKDLKAGIGNSIRTGFKRIDGAMNRYLYAMFEGIAGEVAAQKASGLLGRVTGAGAGRVVMGSAIPAIAAGTTTAQAAAIGVGGVSAAGVAGGLGIFALAAVGLGALFTVVDSAVRNGNLSKAKEDLGGFFNNIQWGLDELVNSRSVQKLREIEASQEAFEKQVKQQQDDLKSGRARFQEFTGSGLTGQQFTVEQFNRMSRDNPNLFQAGNPQAPKPGQYILTRAGDDEWTKKVEDENKQRQAAEEYRNRREQEDQRRREKEDRDRQQRVNEQSQALAKLRETASGSFRLVQETAEGLVDNNPYVKVLADSETAALRMRQQWSFMGDEAVKFNLTLEQNKINLQLMNLEMDSFTKAQDIWNKINRDEINIQRPGLNRRQQDAQNVVMASISAINGISQIREREAAIMGRPSDGFERTRNLKNQIAELEQSLIGGWAGGGDVRAMREAINAAVLQAIEGSGLSARQIGNDPFLRDVSLRAYGEQRVELIRKVQDEQRKASLNRMEDDLLGTNLRQAGMARDTIRQNAINRGLDPERAERESLRFLDRYTVARTDNMDPRDMTFDQFQARQEALKREAVRTVEEQREARQAVQKGLQYQEMMLNEIRVLRTAILGGDVSILIQVLNETQARIDQEALQEADGAGFNVPLRSSADQRQNPYSGDFARYGRGGRR